MGGRKGKEGQSGRVSTFGRLRECGKEKAKE